MPLFSKSKNYIGIDFDSNSVKIVELKNEGGRPRLATYGYIDKEINGLLSSENKGDANEIGKLIKQVGKKAKVTTNQAVAALPSFSVFSSILSLPEMSKKDLASAIKWEAKKVIPLPAEEMILDWKVLDSDEKNKAGEKPKEKKESNDAKKDESVQEDENSEDDEKDDGFLKISQKTKNKSTKVLLTAAPKDLVKRYMEIFKASGFALLSLDTEPLALIRSLASNDKSPLMIVDIGSVVTNISISVNAVPILSRSLDVGGMTITKSIANSLNVSLSRAEQFKYDIGMNPMRAGQGSVPKTIENALVPIIDELKYSINLYRNQGKNNIEKIILTGGSSLLLNLPEYLSNVLGIRSFLGDPWARVIYPEELRPVLDEIGCRFSIAVGLAMRNIE